MKKLIIILITLMCMTALGYMHVYAAGGEDIDYQSLQSLSNKIQHADGFVPDISIKSIIENYKKGKGSGISISVIADSLAAYGLNEVKANIKLLMELIVLSLICGILKNIQSSFENEGTGQIAFYACYLLISVLIIKSAVSVTSIGRDTVDSMLEIINSMIPPLMMLIAASGGITAAASIDPAVLFAAKLTGDLIRGVIIPAAMFTVMLSVVNNMNSDIKLKKLEGLLKQCSIWLLSLILTVFGAFIGIRSSMGETLDQVSLKTAKFAVDSLVPIVGKCLSDAVATVAGYAALLKNAVSLFGLIILALACIFPLLKILIIVLVYKLAGAIIEPVSDNRISECLNSAGNSLMIVFAAVLSTALMFFIIITIIISTGKLINVAG